jgi:hypothetical protein
MMPDVERLTRPQRTFARGLLTVRSGKASRRVRITRAITGGLSLIAFLAFIGLYWIHWEWGVAFVAGIVAGFAAVIYLHAMAAEDRLSVILRVCNWDEVERLVAEDGTNSNQTPDRAG